MSPATAKPSLTAAAGTILLAAACISLIRRRRKEKSELSASSSRSESSQTLSLATLASLTPPLPSIVQKLLSNAHLSYLSTSDAERRTSHLSLMRFTYLAQEEVIIMSTNRNTKKFDLLERQKGVALLVHDFGGKGTDNSGSYSITLNGDCFIVEAGDDCERYRAAHLKHNPDYPQFIVGENIAILCVMVTSASICNIDDHVQKWDINNGPALTS
jgi:hypothetical protein